MISFFWIYENFACVYTIYIPIATRPTTYYVAATYEEKYYDSWKFSLLSSKKEANKVILTTRLYFFFTEEPVLYPFLSKLHKNNLLFLHISRVLYH